MPMDSTAELTQGAKDAPRPLRTANQIAEARVRFWRVVIVASFFAVLIGGSLLAGGVAMIGHMNSQSKTDAAAKYKTARISRPMLDGVFCHNLVLDNNS